MRCLACDRKLNDFESTRKYASSGTFVDLCNRCFSEISEDVPDLEGDGVNLPDLSDEEFNGEIERDLNDNGYYDEDGH